MRTYGRTDRHDETNINFFFENLKTRLKSVKTNNGPVSLRNYYQNWITFYIAPDEPGFMIGT